MPRKKAASEAGSEPSTQPVKKFKPNPEENSKMESSTRRSLRTRSYDENNVGNQPTAQSKKVAEAAINQPRRTVLQAAEAKPATRGSGFVVKTPSPKNSCPLELSVQVTPCDILERQPALPSSKESASRKRKVKISPKSIEKRTKLNPTGSPTSSLEEFQTVSYSKKHSEDMSSGENSVHSTDATHTDVVDANVLDNLKTKYEAAISQHRVSGHSSLAGLPEQLPALNADPLFTRPVVKLHKVDIEVGASVSVMTYNILADCHLQTHSSQYSYTSDAHLSLDYRGYRIIEEIKHLDCDVVCLQEVDDFFYEKSLRPAMKMLGYEGVFYRRKGDGYPEGASTFYRSSTYTLDSQHACSYAQLANQDIDKSEHSEETKQLLRQHVNKEAVLLTCKLRHKRTDKLVVIGNTHLTWTKFTALDISCMQMCYAFKEMDRLSEHGEIPMVLAGDFNTRNTDPGYQLALEGYLNDASLKTLQQLRTVTYADGTERALVDLLWCAFQHPARNIASSYFTIMGKEPAKTSINFVMNSAVDYMWSNNVQPVSVTQTNSICHEMPNIIFPSDHLSLQATYAF